MRTQEKFLTAALALAAVSLLALIFSVKMNVSAFALRALGVLICSVLGANVGVGSRTEGKRKKKKSVRREGGIQALKWCLESLSWHVMDDFPSYSNR